METRGIRNKNPLNIRKGANWLGLAQSQPDKAFVTFTSIEFGIRAGIKLIRNYITGWGGRRRKYCTVDAIISKWAPPTENNTENYILFVCKESGLLRYSALGPNDKNSIFALMAAMCKMESKYDLSRSMFDSAWSLL